MPIGQTPCTERFLRLREQAAAQPARRIDAGQPVWVFGAGHFGRALARAMQAQGLAVAGFVETTPQAPEVQGLPVLDWPTLARTAPHALLALGILNIRQGRLAAHRACMLLMVAATSGAVFFRIFLALWAIFGTRRGFETFYACDAWIAWLLPLGATALVLSHPRWRWDDRGERAQTALPVESA